MKNKKFAGIIALTMLLIFAFVAQSFAASGKYNAANYTSKYSSYRSNCFMFARQVLIDEGRGYFTSYTNNYRVLTGHNGTLVAQHLNNVNGTPSESQIKAAFQKAQVGDVVQMFWQWSSTSQHTAIIAEIGDNYVEFLEANNPRGKIQNNRYSYGSSANGMWGALQTLYSRPGSRGGFSIYRFGASAPEITERPTLSGLVAGQYYSFQWKGENVETWGTSSGNIPSGMESYSRASLPPGLTMNPSTGVISGTVSHTSDAQNAYREFRYFFNVTASNSKGTSQSSEWFAVVEPPVITTSALKDATLRSSYSQEIKADGTEWSMTWKLIGSLPPGLTFNKSKSKRTASITGIPTKAGSYSFKIRLYNLVGNPETTTEKSFTINVGPIKPYKDTRINILYSFKDGRVGEEYSDWLKITDSGKTATIDGTNYTSSFVYVNSQTIVLPYKTKLSWSGSSVYLQCTPRVAQEYNFRIRVSRNSDGGYNEKDFKLVIKEGRPFADSNMRILNNSFSSQNPKENVSYNGMIATVGGAKPYKVSLVASGGTLPPGLSLGQSGSYTYLYGIPKRAGTFNFKIRVTGAHNGYVEKSFRVVVEANSARKSGDPGDGSGAKPKIVSKVLDNAIVGTEYEATIEASGTTPITWTAEEIPEGFYLEEAGEASVKIKGIPTEYGKYKFRIKVENAIGSITKTLKLKVLKNPPVIITDTLPDGAKGVYYEYQLEAEGYEPLKWKKSGKLPSGLKLDKTNGIIYGTPKKAGTYSFILKAKNKAGACEIPVQIVITDKEPEKAGTDSSTSTATQTMGVNVITENETKSDNKGFSAAQTELNVVSGDEKLEGSINATPEAPLNFGIGKWVDEFGRNIHVSDVKILLNDEVLENIEISDEGTFTLSGDIVKGEFTVQVKGNSNGREFTTNEINIMASSEGLESSESDPSVENSSGGCNAGFFGMIVLGAVVLLRKKHR